jgi:hypothetical protein
MGESRDVYSDLVGKYEAKRPLRRPRLRWELILIWIFRKWNGVGGGVNMNRIELAQDRDRWPALVNAVMNLRIP